MMRSEKSSRLLDLDRDHPTTAGDVSALREARREKIRDLKSYLEFLSRLPKPSESAVRNRKGNAGSQPFAL